MKLEEIIYLRDHFMHRTPRTKEDDEAIAQLDKALYATARDLKKLVPTDY